MHQVFRPDERFFRNQADLVIRFAQRQGIDVTKVKSVGVNCGASCLLGYLYFEDGTSVVVKAQ